MSNCYQRLTLDDASDASLEDVALVAGDPEVMDFEADEELPPPTTVMVLVRFAGFKSLLSENLLKAELRLELDVCLLLLLFDEVVAGEGC
jgi:hypothetical protein